MTVSQEIARFVCGLRPDSIPLPIQQRLRACLLNGYGIGLGGLATPYHRVAAQAAIATDGESARGATMLGDGRRTNLSAAILANSALFHGLAQEDTCGTVHLGAIVIPMLTAMIEAKSYPLARLMPALLAGYEVAGLFDKPYGAMTAPMGLRASPLYGTLGAAAAAGYMMNLGEAQMAAALANAASFTGGILQAFSDGTDEWRYQVGVAGRNGLMGAALAQAGSVSAPHAFEGKAGFVRAYVRTDCEPEALLGRLGAEWAVNRVTFKPYPVCAFNQTPVEAALGLREKLANRSIVSLVVRMNPYETGYAGMLEKGPFSTISGTLMSIPFCIATTLLHGVPTIGQMNTYDDPAVAALVEKITVVSDAAVPNLSTVINAELEDGSHVTQDQHMTAADYAYDWDGVSRLVRRIGLEQGLPPAIYGRLERFVGTLPDGNVRDLVAVFGEAAAVSGAR